MYSDRGGGTESGGKVLRMPLDFSERRLVDTGSFQD